MARTHMTVVRLSDEERARLATLATELGVTRSEVLRTALREYCRDEGEAEPLDMVAADALGVGTAE